MQKKKIEWLNGKKINPERDTRNSEEPVKTENKTNKHTNNTLNIVVKGNTKIKEKKRLPKRKIENQDGRK